jgi:glycosyltransferase involved in cell wall biosynthesis
VNASDAPAGSERISVVLPIYKNRPQLPDLHRRLTEVLTARGSDYELVFVDDAGGDGSLEWLRQCRQADVHVTLVELPANGGQHAAVLAGLSRASS